MKADFLALRQGNTTVVEYERRFDELAVVVFSLSCGGATFMEINSKCIRTIRSSSISSHKKT